MAPVTRQAAKYKRNLKGLHALVQKQIKLVECLQSKKLLESALYHLHFARNLLGSQLIMFPGYYFTFKKQTRWALNHLASAHEALGNQDACHVSMGYKQASLAKVVKARNVGLRRRQGNIFQNRAL